MHDAICHLFQDCFVILRWLPEYGTSPCVLCTYRTNPVLSDWHNVELSTVLVLSPGSRSWLTTRDQASLFEDSNTSNSYLRGILKTKWGDWWGFFTHVELVPAYLSELRTIDESLYKARRYPHTTSRYPHNTLSEATTLGILLVAGGGLTIEGVWHFIYNF